MDSIIQQVKDLYAQADARGRTAIQRDIDQLQGCLYSEMESLIHLAANVVRRRAISLQILLQLITRTAAGKVCNDLDWSRLAYVRCLRKERCTYDDLTTSSKSGSGRWASD